MATACERLDEFVKDYLLFRGFTGTAKALDHELKHDKDKGLRADKIVEQLIAYVGSHDLQHLREYWAYLNQRFFSRLEQRYAASVRKLEVSLLKLYVVNAHQSNRQDRVRDFFEKIGSELQNQVEFRDWFAFPFLTNPGENGNFALYFTRQWQETVQLSLHNFLQVVLQAMPVPTLLNFDYDCKRMQALQDENESLKNQIHCGAVPNKKVQPVKCSYQSSQSQPLPDLIYDFSGLAESTQETGSEIVHERQKTSRRFPINLPTPLLKRNKQPDTRQDTATGNSQQVNNYSNQSSNNVTADTHSHAFMQPHSAPVSNTGNTSSGFFNASAATAGNANMSGQRPSVTKVTGEPPSTGTSSNTQLPKTGEVLGPPGTRKKAPRELTSFPPYSSPVSEKNESLPDKTSKLDANERPQNQDQGDTMGAQTEPGVQEEVFPGASQSLPIALDYGPVEPLHQIPKGKSCPFLVLSDDEYLEHQSAVCYSRFSLSGQHVASLDADGIVKVWTWSPQPSTTATVMSRSPFLSLDWASKSDRWLLLGNQSGQIRLFDTREIKTFREASVESSNMRVTYLSTCPSSMTFASCLSCGFESNLDSDKLALWDLKTMKMERYLPIEPQAVSMTCCMYSNNGKLLLAGGTDGVVRFYDVNQRHCVKSWKVSQGPVQTIQFAHQETVFFTMGSEGILSEWSLGETSHPTCQIGISEGARDPTSQVVGQDGESLPRGQAFRLSKDKAYLLCSIQRHGVICKIGDSQAKGNWHRILDLSSHGDIVTTVDWSPSIDTPVCLTGARDGCVKVATLLSQ